MNTQCDKNDEEIAQDLEDYADAFYEHLADLCSQKHQLDKEIGYRKNTIEKLKRAHSELQSEKEQLEKIIAQEKTFITIGQLVCETLNCSFENISLDALREYMDTHREDMRTISLVYRDDNNAHEDNSEENYL